MSSNSNSFEDNKSSPMILKALCVEGSQIHRIIMYQYRLQFHKVDGKSYLGYIQLFCKKLIYHYWKLELFLLNLYLK